MASRLDAADIITQATMATTLVKMLVDLVKLCWGGDTGRPPTWVPPITSLAAGIGVLMLLALALDQDLSQARVLASTVLAGLMAAVGAIGVTELHRLARQAGPGAIEASTPLSLSASKVTAGFTPSLTIPSQGGGDSAPSLASRLAERPNGVGTGEEPALSALRTPSPALAGHSESLSKGWGAGTVAPSSGGAAGSWRS